MNRSFYSEGLRRSASGVVIGLALATAGSAAADETCQSPYMAKVTGHQEFVYASAIGIEGLGDGSDKVVTVDVRPDSPTYGQVIDVESVGGLHEAHHGDFTDDRRFLWVSGLDSSQIFIVDVHTDPANPRLIKTIDDVLAIRVRPLRPHEFEARTFQACALVGGSIARSVPATPAPGRAG
jgi:methanethiol oxidase